MLEDFLGNSAAGVRHAEHDILPGGDIADADLGRFVDGLCRDFFDALGRANADFPAGIDVVLVAPDGRIAAIPRSSRIQTRTEA